MINTYNTVSLLTAREQYGVKKPYTTATTMACKIARIRSDRVRPVDLATSSAWNPRRLQNMILAVGVETPASILHSVSTSTSLGSSSSSSSSASSSSSSEEDDDPGNDCGNDEDSLSSYEGESSRMTTNAQSQRFKRAEGSTGGIDLCRKSLNERAQGGDRKDLKREGSANHNIDTDSSTREDNEEDVRVEDADDDDDDARRHELVRSGMKRSPCSISSQLSSNRGCVDSISSASGNHLLANNLRNNEADDGSQYESMSDNSSRVRSYPANQQLDASHRASMSHSGCINTAAWLNCPWRLSKAQTGDHNNMNSFVLSSSQSSNASANIDSINWNADNRARPIETMECTTQLLTSGDDKLVKFWDVSNSIGRASPFECSATTCPYSQDVQSTNPSVVMEWKRRCKRGRNLPGMVNHLATMNSGHTSNVFHVTPIPNRPGEIASCAADGCLHLSDIEKQCTNSPAVTSPTVIISPEHNGFEAWSLRKMCFSHHFLDSNTGLLCSQKGLQLFDLRLPPQSQSSRNLLSSMPEGCKSCAVFSKSEAQLEDISVESAYVFAGGSYGDVSLYDLRFISSDTTKVVQTYRPSCFRKNITISISGIDISRDKRELLISYENDQVYTFPILPFVSTAGPSIEELVQYTLPMEQSQQSKRKQPELAAYGAHLNRLTFLKNAKYAGPSDEYICTGSDSGHAWIYEKATGAVVSLLCADKSTCNGIVPHSHLPLFVTYGIEITAKLWCATTPVNDKIDDSDLGRSNYFKQKKYEISALAQEWDNCQSKIARLDELNSYEGGDDVTIFVPSEIVSRDIDSDDDPYENFLFGGGGARGSFNPVRIGNDLRNLPEVLRDNYFTCANAIATDEEPPVRCGLKELRRRVSLIRLHHQCQQLGVKINPNMPWILRPSDFIKQHFDKEERLNKFYGNVADLIPDCPSDLICFDPTFAKNHHQPCGAAFNVKCYQVFFLEQYSRRLNSLGYTSVDTFINNNDSYRQHDDEDAPKKIDKSQNKCISKNANGTTGDENSFGNSLTDATKSWDALHEIILNLKHEGNAVLQAGLTNLAAQYYDKAIQYCALGFMNFPAGSAKFIQTNQSLLDKDGWMSTRWTPLLKTFISIRLNLSIVMLKEEMKNIRGACAQAKLALHDLNPFTLSKGKVFYAKKSKKPRDNEPVETYIEAKELQAKAYFRLGSAKLILGSYSRAVQCFESSIKCTKEADSGAKIENIVLRRIAEAKRAKDRQKVQQRKKFKRIFSKEDGKG